LSTKFIFILNFYVCVARGGARGMYGSRSASLIFDTTWTYLTFYFLINFNSFIMCNNMYHKFTK